MAVRPDAGVIPSEEVISRQAGGGFILSGRASGCRELSV
jgi:hypothetical protein